MPQVDDILARFPGPVTLYMGRGKNLVTLAVCVAFAAFMVWVVINPRERLLHPVWYDRIMVWLALATFAGVAIRSVFLLAWPRSASLTLDGDGFELGRVFSRVRRAWRGVGDVRVDKFTMGYVAIAYNVPEPGAGPGGSSKVARHFTDAYGLPREELARLMNEWRKRALAQDDHRPPRSVPTIRLSGA